MENIDDYLNSLTGPEKQILKRIRERICTVIPECVETMSYGIPTFKYKGKSVMHIAAFKDHLSLFPGPQAINEFQDRLAEYKHAKGTIRFHAEKPVPTRLIEEIVRFNMAAVDRSD